MMGNETYICSIDRRDILLQIAESGFEFLQRCFFCRRHHPFKWRCVAARAHQSQDSNTGEDESNCSGHCETPVYRG